MTKPSETATANRKGGVRGDRAVSRRNFIKAGVGGAAGLGVVSHARAEFLETPKESGLIRGRLPSSVLNNAYDPDLVLLIDRITGGFSVAEYEHAESIGGYDAYLAEQLDPFGNNLIGPTNDPGLWNRLQDVDDEPYDIINETGQAIWLEYKDDNRSGLPLSQLTSISVMFAVYARAQLYYRMFQFCNHHLNIEVLSNTAQRFVLWPFLRDVVLANCMGNFGQLILDSAESAAMMLYLNNRTNRFGNIDENYGRELLELHTLGVDNGYDETDVHNAARILTGWSACFKNTCADNYGSYVYGDFWFRPDKHDLGQKTVMGKTFDGQSGLAGQNEGIDLINFLTTHPNCADFIARKLCRFFLGGLSFNYDPPEDVVQIVRWTFLNNPVAIGDIPSMLAVILSKDILTQYAVPKLRRPFDLMTASLRAVKADIQPEVAGGDNLMIRLRSDLNLMGMHPQYWAPPDGPADSKAWSEGGLLTRWQYLTKLANNDNAPEVTNFNVGGVGGLLEDVGAIPGMEAQALNDLLTGGRLDPKEVVAVKEFLGATPSESRLKQGLAFAMQLPTYQFI